MKYLEIFEAHREVIADPDNIYPGAEDSETCTRSTRAPTAAEHYSISTWFNDRRMLNIE